jgi:hypothetical protein
MPYETITVPFSIHEVFQVLEESLAAAFQVKTSQLLGATISQVKPVGRTSVTLHQTVLAVDPGERIQFETLDPFDRSITTYTLEKVEDGTIVRLSEDISSERLTRRWNYFLFDLPFISGFARKRLRRQLNALTHALEAKP